MGAITIELPVTFARSYLIPRAHCTLIYLGQTGQHFYDRGKLEDAAARLGVAMGPSASYVKVTGVTVMAKGACTVLTLDSYKLKSYRHFIDRELARYGYRSLSQYSYNPHVTINKHTVSSEPVFPWEGFQLPPEILLDPPVVHWNED